MTKLFTAFFETLCKYGYNFILSIFLTCLTIYILYKTKYPYIFNLLESNDGRIKFILFVCGTCCLFTYICYLSKLCKEKICNVAKNNKRKNHIAKNIAMIINNTEIYNYEFSILSLLVIKNIRSFNADILLKIYSELHPEIKNLYELRKRYQTAIYRLKNLKIVNSEGVDFYSIDEELFEVLIEENKINGHSK